MFTDSHCHITCDRLYMRIDEIIENIKNKNITSCMIMCTSPEELDRAKKLKKIIHSLKLHLVGFLPMQKKLGIKKSNI